MIGDDDHDPRLRGRARRALALRGREPPAQLGEPAQRSGGHGEGGVPGDGRAAGLGVAFRAKPVVAAEAHASIVHGDLTGLLYLQGYRKREFVEPT